MIGKLAERPRLVIAVASLLSLMGVVAWLTMPREEDPKIAARAALVVAPFPGASALDVERLVVVRLEEQLAEVAQLEHVDVTVRLADEALKFEYVSTLYVRFEVADGFHIYADPLPDGFIASTATVADTPGVRLGEPVYPPTRKREFPKLGVTLNVYDGATDIAIPIALNSEILDWPIQDKPTSIEIPGLPGTYHRFTAFALPSLLGILFFDLGRLLRLRLRWFDWPAIGYVLVPIATSVSNGLGVYDGLSNSAKRTMLYAVYSAKREATRAKRIADAVAQLDDES